MNRPAKQRPRFVPAVHRLRPWYHDFAGLGLKTDFDGLLEGRPSAVLAAVRESLSGRRVERGGRHPILDALRPGPPPHRLNQVAKESVIRPLMELALELVERPSCLDLFCSDGYYSCLLASLEPEARVLGVDLDPAEIRRARTAATALGLYNAQFLVDEANAFLQREAGFGLVLCLGGLYHLAQPRSLLADLRQVCHGLLLVQSVVSLEHEAPDYYVTPAPNWRHGSRFSHARLASWLADSGWQVIEERRNELPGNRQPCDRGSSYFLCRADGPTADDKASSSLDHG